MPLYAKQPAWLMGAWFVFTLAASALHLYQTGPGQPPLPLGLAALIPVLLFLVWFARSRGFREFMLSLNPRLLTMVQSWRLVGFVFLVLASYGVLPRMFALPAGWGDITIGATATLAALYLANPEHRGSFLAWQVLGIADLAMAVLLGTLSRVFDPQSIPTSGMTVLPLSLIPAFAVPLLLILHLVCIAQARRWPNPSPSAAKNGLQSASL